MSVNAHLNYIFAVKPYQQRLGRLKWIITMTSPLRTMPLPTLERKILQYAKQKEKKWISQLDGPQKIIKDSSHARELIIWAINYFLINNKKHTWTWKGRVLDSLISQKEKKAFLEREVDSPNPLKLTMRQNLFYLYILLHADGLFLIPFLKELSFMKEFKLSSEKEFLEEDARNVYSNSWIILAEALMNSSSYNKRKIGKNLKKRIKGSKRSNGLKPRSLYIKALTKLEALVDLQLLKRQSKYQAHYLPLKEKLNEFDSFPPLDELIRKNRLEESLNEIFFHIASKIYNLDKESVESNRFELLERYIAESYCKLTSKGWQIIKRNELNLLTSIMALTKHPLLIVEPKEVADFQLELMDKYGPKQIQLFGDYEGKLSSIKIDKTTIKKMLGS